LTTSYLVVMVLILINVFIAILMDAYNIVVADPRTECTLAEEMEEGFVRRWSGRGQPDVEELYPALLEHGYRGNYSYNQLVQLVKSPLQGRTDHLVRSLHTDLAELNHKDVMMYYTGKAADRMDESTPLLNEPLSVLTPEDESGSTTILLKDASTESTVPLSSSQPDIDAQVLHNMSPTDMDATLANASPEALAAMSPEDRAKVHAQISPAESTNLETDFEQADRVRNVVELLFERYDLDGSGTIGHDGAEMKQMITALFFKLEIGSSSETVTKVGGDVTPGTQMDLGEFQDWFPAAVEKAGLTIPKKKHG